MNALFLLNGLPHHLSSVFTALVRVICACRHSAQWHGCLARRKASHTPLLRRDVSIAVQAPYPYRAQLFWPVYLYGVLVHAYLFFLCPAGMTQQVLHIHVIVQYCIVAFMTASFKSSTEFMQRLLKFTY